jgi:hypothetical protein
MGTPLVMYFVSDACFKVPVTENKTISIVNTKDKDAGFVILNFK